MTVEIGQVAPAFELLDQDKNQVSPESLRGRKSLIVFIPFPFTGICDGESCMIRDNLASLNDLDANVVVITCTPRPSNKKWADENGFGFSVLSDYWPHGEVATAYEAFNRTVGAANRVTFVLDANGAIRKIIDSGSLGTPREFDEYVTALAEA